MNQIINSLRALLNTLEIRYNKTMPTYPPMITKWAQAIALAEGADLKLNNPGDLKLSSLTKSWGAVAGFTATDGGAIASFLTYTAGFNALCNFLQLGCEDELVAFHSAESRTLTGFMKIYAGKPPQNYINLIVGYLEVDPTVQISTFLT